MRKKYESKLLEYAERFHTANAKFYGAAGELIETDMGPELTWDVPIDREGATYDMLTAIFDMLFDIMEHMYEDKK